MNTREMAERLIGDLGLDANIEEVAGSLEEYFCNHRPVIVHTREYVVSRLNGMGYKPTDDQVDDALDALEKGFGWAGETVADIEEDILSEFVERNGIQELTDDETEKCGWSPVISQ